MIICAEVLDGRITTRTAKARHDRVPIKFALVFLFIGFLS